VVSKLGLGLFVDDGDFTNGVRRAHTRGLIRSMLCGFVRELVRSDLPQLAGWSRTLSYPDDTVNFVSLTHIVAEPRAGENNNYRMISDHTHYHARDSVSAM